MDPTTIPETLDEGPTEEEKRIEEARKGMPGVDGMLLVHDFEDWAEKVLSGTAWNYYKSAGKHPSRTGQRTVADGVQRTERSVCVLTLWDVGSGDMRLTRTAAQENQDAFRNYYFRPRILRDVTTGSINSEFMGIKTDMPIFISPAAMAKLGHPDGEINLTKGAGQCGIVQGVGSFLSPLRSAG